MVRDLILLDTAHIECFAHFIKVLKQKRGSHGKSLLDDTIVLLGTGMGDASRHSNRDLPTLVAGGNLKHQGHFAVTKENETLLGDLSTSQSRKVSA